MAFGVAVKLTGNIAKDLLKEKKRLRRVLPKAMGLAAKKVAGRSSAHVAAAGLPRSIARFATPTYGGRDSDNPAALVASKAPRILKAQDRGDTIRVRRARFLVLPTSQAIKLGLAATLRPKGRSQVAGRKSKYSNVEAAIRRFGKLRFVKRPGGGGLLVADNLTAGGRRSKVRTSKKTGLQSSAIGGRRISIPLFILVKQVRLRKKTRLRENWTRWADIELGRAVQAQVDRGHF